MTENGLNVNPAHALADTKPSSGQNRVFKELKTLFVLSFIYKKRVVGYSRLTSSPGERGTVPSPSPGGKQKGVLTMSESRKNVLRDDIETIGPVLDNPFLRGIILSPATLSAKEEYCRQRRFSSDLIARIRIACKILERYGTEVWESVQVPRRRPAAVLNFASEADCPLEETSVLQSVQIDETTEPIDQSTLPFLLRDLSIHRHGDSYRTTFDGIGTSILPEICKSLSEELDTPKGIKTLPAIELIFDPDGKWVFGNFIKPENVPQVRVRVGWVMGKSQCCPIPIWYREIEIVIWQPFSEGQPCIRDRVRLVVPMDFYRTSTGQVNYVGLLRLERLMSVNDKPERWSNADAVMEVHLNIHQNGDYWSAIQDKPNSRLRPKISTLANEDASFHRRGNTPGDTVKTMATLAELHLKIIQNNSPHFDLDYLIGFPFMRNPNVDPFKLLIGK